ncbi:MAG TPA: ammonium transporter [Euryarchaeota archaeon]|nr:ammonia channel precursor [archaeon BMS3Bbin16]HDH28270.1 ammonium transporter [Euryarchaeota archaeon]
MNKRITIVLLALMIVAGLLPVALGADPSGGATLADDPLAPLTYIWLLVAGFLVFFMQAGFAMVEAGFTRAKNTANILMKNIMDFAVGSLAFMAVGYGLMMGADHYGLFGTGMWFLAGDAYDVGVYLNWFFMVVFAATAATIVSGAMAERTKFKSYLMYSVIISLIIYPVYGHWVWGGGWLMTGSIFGKLGLLATDGSPLWFADFAGSSVVHQLGGWIALMGAVMLGPRIGKYGKDGEPRAIPGHNIALAVLGGFILWFGWYGFNAGSTLSGTELRIAVIVVTTTLAAAAGATIAMFYSWARIGKPDVGMTVNGFLAGLVAITAGTAWVGAPEAVLIGAIAGFLVVEAVLFIENRGVDDPVGAVAVHGVNGFWGTIAVGLFADGTYGNYAVPGVGNPAIVGLFHGGGTGQLIVQFIGAGAALLWALAAGFIMFKGIDMLFGLRVSHDEEIEGLDIGEHGISAYPDFVIARTEGE